MPVPHVSGAFGDLLDPRFQKIFHGYLKTYPDMVGDFFTMTPHNGRNNMMWSDVGEVGDFEEFTGSIGYKSQSQGYDVTMTYVEFGNGIQVERKLYDDDQYHIMDQKPQALARAWVRTRQKHAARPFNNAFSVDTFFYSHSEGVALCSDSHTTTSGASTASGFDNKGTAALTATAVAANRVQMRGFRGDIGEVISVKADELLVPPGLEEQAFEITKSMGKVDTANNNANWNNGALTVKVWDYLTDSNNWFMMDGAARKENLFWSDRVPIEFAMIEDFDTLIAKWRGYGRYANAYRQWRWIMGNQVS